MWAAIATVAASLISRAGSSSGGGGGGGPTSIQSGAPNFIDSGFDSSQWTVSTGSSSARAENSKVDVPPIAAAGLALQSNVPYGYDVGGGANRAGFGDFGDVLPVILLAAGLAFVVRSKG